VAGTVLLVDFAGMTLSQVWQFTPHFAKLVLDWIQVRPNGLGVSIVPLKKLYPK